MSSKLSNEEQIKVYRNANGVMGIVVFCLTLYGFISGTVEDSAILVFGSAFSTEALTEYKYTKKKKSLISGIIMLVVSILCAISFIKHI